MQLTVTIRDGQPVEPDQVAAQFSGSLRSILSLERIGLNFISHLSGVATFTNQYVQAVKGTKAKIYDTRKTIPGLRALQKYAVACGGGHNHRMGLYDAVLVKDNHLASIPLKALPEVLRQAVGQIPNTTQAAVPIGLEVDRLQQLQALLSSSVVSRVNMILLDNMTTDDMRQAVEMRDRSAPHLQLEASGNVTLNNVRDVAATGVDRIAVGAITHSAPSLDVGLDIL